MIDKLFTDIKKNQFRMSRNVGAMHTLATCKDNRGFTVVELLLYLALLSIVLASIFSFFGFAQKSWNHAEAQDIVIQEARIFLMQVERDIRSAQRRPDGEPAVKILEQGMRMDIFTNHNHDELYVSYIYQNNGSLKRISLVDPNDANELPLQQTFLSLVVPNVDSNGDDLPLFSIDGKSVVLDFGIDNPGNPLHRVYKIDSIFTVRNKGAL